MSSSEAAAACVGYLQADTEMRRATCFLTQTTTVKATRFRPHDGRLKSETYIVTIGGPNHAEKRKLARGSVSGTGEFRFQGWSKKKAS